MTEYVSTGRFPRRCEIGDAHLISGQRDHAATGELLYTFERQHEFGLSRDV